MFIVQSASPGHVGHMWMWEFFLSLFLLVFLFLPRLQCNFLCEYDCAFKIDRNAFLFHLYIPLRFLQLWHRSLYYPWWWSSDSLSLVRISHCVRAMCFIWAAIILFESSLLWNKRLVGRSVGRWVVGWLAVYSAGVLFCSVLFGAVQRHAIEKNKSAV